MNNYEEKQARRKAYYEAKSKALENEAKALSNRASEMASVIPFGQPILIGHHSERRDRRYRERIHNTFAKSFDTQKKAEYYAQKAESVGMGGISSDDPEAIKKLQEELAERKAKQELMKSANKIIRTVKTNEERLLKLVELGISEDKAKEILELDCHGAIGFPSYKLTNNNANIRRIEARIKSLENAAKREYQEISGNGYVCKQDVEENRLLFIFDGKPDEDTRKYLKSNGFKWSPTRTAWVRMLNNQGVRAAKRVVEYLNNK